MDIPVQLKYSQTGQGTVAARLLHGDDVGTWLSLVASFRVPTSTVQFLPIFETIAGQSSTVGVLCIFSSSTERASETGTTGQSVVDYTCRVGQLYVPVDSVLSPDISDEELRKLLPVESDRIFVWHPISGLIEFEPEQMLTAAQLLTAPLSSDVVWDAASSGPHLNRVIRILRPEPISDFMRVLDDGQDDIGTESKNIDDAPRSPDEKSGVVIRDALQGVKHGIAKAVHGITSNLPTAENGSRTLGNLHQWAESILSGIKDRAGGNGNASDSSGNSRTQSLTTRRENEIKRLLNLLKNNPDEGLKFALPMGGDDRSRGTAAPSDRLSERDVDFGSVDWRGSGRGDAWDLPWEYQAKLIQQYRELAQRELRLGRFRRAAYIYARLLHDFSAAASALEAGKCYQDAANIYLEQLHDPIKAAKCLRNGGFWEEAVQIYRNRERWIDAAELYEEMGDTAEASAMFRTEISACERRRDYVAAAAVADTRLDDAETATELLITGWMQGTQGRNCARQLLKMHARRGSHTQAEAILGQLTNEKELSSTQIEDAVTVCSENAAEYPEKSVREAARRHTWRLSAALLKEESEWDHQPSTIATALASIRRLEVGDAVLQADTHRYETQLRSQHVPPEDLAASSAAKKSIVKGSVKVIGVTAAPVAAPAGTNWTNIVGNGSFVFRQGVTPRGHVVVVRQMLGTRRDGLLATDDRLIQLPTRINHAENLRLRLDYRNPDCVLLMPLPAASQWCDDQANLNVLSDAEFIKVHLPDVGLVVDVCTTSTGWTWALTTSMDTEQPQFELHAINPSNLVDRSFKIDMPGQVIDNIRMETEPRLISDGYGFFILLDRSLLRVQESVRQALDAQTGAVLGTRIVESFPFAPGYITVSPDSTMTRLAISFEEGVRAVWKSTHSSCTFAHDMFRSVTAFSSNGIFAAACQQSNRIDFYRLARGQAMQLASYGSMKSIQHLTCGPTPNQVLVFHHDGSSTQLEIPF